MNRIPDRPGGIASSAQTVVEPVARPGEAAAPARTVSDAPAPALPRPGLDLTPQANLGLLEHLDKPQWRNPLTPKISLGLGTTQGADGSSSFSIEFSFQMDWEDPRAWKELWRLLTTPRPETPTETHDRVLAEQGDDTKACLAQAEALRRAGKYADAGPLLMRVLHNTDATPTVVAMAREQLALIFDLAAARAGVLFEESLSRCRDIDVMRSPTATIEQVRMALGVLDRQRQVLVQTHDLYREAVTLLPPNRGEPDPYAGMRRDLEHNAAASLAALANCAEQARRVQAHLLDVCKLPTTRGQLTRERQALAGEPDLLGRPSAPPMRSVVELPAWAQAAGDLAAGIDEIVRTRSGGEPLEP